MFGDQPSSRALTQSISKRMVRVEFVQGLGQSARVRGMGEKSRRDTILETFRDTFQCDNRSRRLHVVEKLNGESAAPCPGHHKASGAMNQRPHGLELFYGNDSKTPPERLADVRRSIRIVGGHNDGRLLL